MVIKVHTVNGRIVLDPTMLDSLEFQNELKRCEKKGYVDVKVKKVGSDYSTNQQSLWHKLVGLYFTSGCHSSDSYNSLRSTLKYRYGVISSYFYVLDDGTNLIKPTYDPPPSNMHERIPLLETTTKYNKEEYSHLIDGTIAEMKQSGILETARYSGEFMDLLNTLE